MLTGLLKKHAAALTKRVNGGGGPHPTSSSASLTPEPKVSPMAMGTAEGRDFFFKLAAKRRTTACCPIRVGCDIERN